MHDKRFKLIYFSTGGSEVREFSLDLKKAALLLSSVLFFCFLLLFGVLSLFTRYFHNAYISSLKKSNSQLQTMLADMEKKVKKIEGSVETIRKTDQKLRTYLEMPDSSVDERKLGRGGLDQQSFASYNINTADVNIINAARVSKLLDELDKRLEFAQKSRNEIAEQAKENDEMWRHIPSINPVTAIDGRLTDRFGWRIHPLTRLKQFHEGLDISAPRRTKVIAPADGEVEVVVVKYAPNQSYGKQVIINHGYGFRTVYAHLNDIFVKEGEKVRRGQVIGTVGDTGRATGPHLHYEVHKDGIAQNPENFILVTD